MPEFVVRGGIATARSLQAGYQRHRGVQNLYDFSVQYRPGRSVLQLANAGQCPNPKISYATDECLILAAQQLGYDVDLVASPGIGFHRTLTASVNGMMVRVLPDDVANALHDCFEQAHNPFQRL